MLDSQRKSPPTNNSTAACITSCDPPAPTCGSEALLLEPRLVHCQLDLLAARQPHGMPKAKNVLVIFCAGACSQLETWDYKPELIKRDGQPMPGGPAVTFQGPAGNLARPQYEFRPRGECGKMVSDMIPHLGDAAVGAGRWKPLGLDADDLRIEIRGDGLHVVAVDRGVESFEYFGRRAHEFDSRGEP